MQSGRAPIQGISATSLQNPSAIALNQLGLAIDVKRDFGASGSAESTTGSISAGSTTLTLASAIDFKNGQGISIAGAGASGALLVTTIVSGAGTTTLTLADAASTAVSAAAVNHDDTATVQAAINGAGVLGATVFFPVGNYNCGPLTMGGGASVQWSTSLEGTGQASRIVFRQTTGDLLYVNKLQRFHIQDLAFDYMSAASSGSLIHLDQCSFGYLDRLFVGFNGPAQYNGINLTNVTGPSEDIHINDTIVAGYTGSGIVFDSTASTSNVLNDLYIDGCWIQSAISSPPSTCTALYLHQSGGAALNAVNITDTEISSGYWGCLTDGIVRFMRATDTYFDAINQFSGLQVATFTGCWFSGSYTASGNPASNAQTFTDCFSVTLSACNIDPASVLNTASACVCIQGTNSNHFTVQGCQIFGAGYIGITVSGGDNVTLTGNYVGNNVNAQNPENIATGVLFYGFTGHATVSNNDLIEITTPISLAGGASGTDMKSSGNHGYNPVGLTTETLPASGSAYTNTSGVRQRIILTGGTMTALDWNGTPTGYTATPVNFELDPGETFTPTYSVAPTMTVFGL